MSVPHRTIQFRPGTPWPLGATVRDGGVNFAVYSEHAAQILLAVFEGKQDEFEIDAPLPVRTGFVWHGFLPNAGPGLRYGFRARTIRSLPWVAIQRVEAVARPYARAISGDITWDDAVFDYQR